MYMYIVSGMAQTPLYIADICHSTANSEINSVVIPHYMYIGHIKSLSCNSAQFHCTLYLYAVYILLCLVCLYWCVVVLYLSFLPVSLISVILLPSLPPSLQRAQSKESKARVLPLEEKFGLRFVVKLKEFQFRLISEMNGRSKHVIIPTSPTLIG